MSTAHKTITTPAEEAAALQLIRENWRLLHWHPWIDRTRPEYGPMMRAEIRDAIAALREYRHSKAAEQLQPLFELIATSAR